MRQITLLTIAALGWTCIAFCTDTILIEDVMSKEEQKKTGVSQLNFNQKRALEAWLNENFVLKTKKETTPLARTLSLNIDNGKELQLSDNTIWEVNPEVCRHLRSGSLRSP